MVGTFTGKTPAEVLLENKSNAHDLEQTANWLSERINNHKGNKKQYEAIMEALNLLKAEALQQDSSKKAVTCPILPIYSAPIRTLENWKRSNDKVLVYGINVFCDTSLDQSPFVVEIVNQYAPLNDDKNPILSQAEDKVNERISLTVEEFANIKRRMERTINMFEDMYAREAFRISQEEEEKNKNKNKKERAC